MKDNRLAPSATQVTTLVHIALVQQGGCCNVAILVHWHNASATRGRGGYNTGTLPHCTLVQQGGDLAMLLNL